MSFLSIPLILQIFCIYHAYKNHKEYHWYLIILFLPLIGSIIYLITQVFNKRDLQQAQDSVTKIINPTKKITELQQKVQFANTHDNQVQLADAFFEIRDYNNAITHYENSLDGLFQKDEYAHRQLVKSYYFIEDFKKAIEKGGIVKDNNDFKKSDGFYYYGLSLAKNGSKEAAKIIFDQINKPFSNYTERLNYAKYLLHENDTVNGKNILDELVQESLQVSKPVKRKNSSIFNDAKKTLESIS